jgi:hypothetical protein
VCAEASFTTLAVEGREPAPSRTRLNVSNLKRMLQIRASLDCVAFNDGSFSGPDSLAAFDRLNTERSIEMEFIAGVLRLADRPAVAMEGIMKAATGGHRVQRDQARRLLEAFAGGGLEEMIAKARSHRPRIELQR